MGPSALMEGFEKYYGMWGHPPHKPLLVYKLPHELPNNLRLGSLQIKIYWESLKYGYRNSLVSTALSINRCFVQEVKNYENTDIKAFGLVPLGFFLLFQIYFAEDTYFAENSSQSPSNFSIFKFFII